MPTSKPGSQPKVATFRIWKRSEPACDACGCLESALVKKQLLSCSGCLLTKYCSKDCQKQDWRAHRDRCHLFECDRKLSTVFAKSLRPGTINDPTLSLPEKGVQWNFLNLDNHAIIACAALNNDAKLAQSANVAIYMMLAPGNHVDSKYDHRTFVIDEVVLLPREDSDEFAVEQNWKEGTATLPSPSVLQKTNHFKLFVCNTSESGSVQMWMLGIGRSLLPPGFDLNRYITHVNRGITHFHASHWPLPRNISDADLEAAQFTEKWLDYAWTHYKALSGLTGQGVIGIENPDGTRTPIYKWSQNGHFRRCAPGETDTDGPEEFKKLLVDPSRMVRKISWYLQEMKDFGDIALSTTEQKFRHEKDTLEKLKQYVRPTG